MRRVAIFAFFLSGASSLIFQSIWSRSAHHVFGATSIAISTVVTAFMAGLGLGAFVAGRYADKIKSEFTPQVRLLAPIEAMVQFQCTGPIGAPGVGTITAPLPLTNPALIGLSIYFQEITARRQAEEALREADRRKDEFLATLAHELRNPLAPLQNALHILRLDPAGGDAGRSALAIEAEALFRRMTGCQSSSEALRMALVISLWRDSRFATASPRPKILPPTWMKSLRRV